MQIFRYIATAGEPMCLASGLFHSDKSFNWKLLRWCHVLLVFFGEGLKHISQCLIVQSSTLGWLKHY